MRTKAPKTEHEQVVAAARSFWWALWSKAQLAEDHDIAAEQYRFAKDVCEKFAEYAKVIDAALFSLTSENVLINWTMAISHPKSHHPVLHRMLRDAKSLRKQLAAFESEPRFDEINLALGHGLLANRELGAGLVEGADWSPKLRQIISGLIDRLDDVIGPSFLVYRTRGAVSEINDYPGLAVLVFGLERAAQRAGGKFTVHRKHAEKGSLIRTLEELRGRLIQTTWGVSLADCLPSPEKHPITKYERIIRDARAAV